jgi:hypothetical protein
MISVEVTGDKELIADLKGYEKESAKAIQKAVDDTALKIKEIAVVRLSGGMGSRMHSVHGGAGLIGSIYNKTVETFERIVGTGTHYAPYIEFGTGDEVFNNFEFDAQARQTAAEYKGKGIRKVNIRGDSFLNFAAVNQRKKFIERITDNLNKIK